MKILSLILLIPIILCCVGCPEDTDPADSELLIINTSDKAIVYYFELKMLGDTSLATIAFPLSPENTESEIINPKDTAVLQEGFKRILSNNPNDILMLYLFSRDIIEQVPWERIEDEYLILRRYDLTLDSLEARDWEIEYP